MIEAAGGRWLRAYGGLDHPNILGGFLALALIVAADLLAEKRTENRKRRGLISVSLFLAYFVVLYGIIGGLLLSNVYRDIDLLFFTPKNITRLSYLRTVKRIFVVFLNFAAAAVFFLIEVGIGTDNFASLFI